MSLDGPLHTLPELGGAEVTAKVNVARLGSDADTQETQELIEARPGVRYARPDVTDTRTTCLRLLEDTREWEEADFSFGFFSGSPDLARPAQDLVLIPPRIPEDKLTAPRSWSPNEGFVESDSTSNRKEEPLCLVASGSRRINRSLEDLPTDIQEHILRCQCSCDHLGYGNFSRKGVARLTNGCSGRLSKMVGSANKQDQDSCRTGKRKDCGVGTRTRAWVCVVLVLGAAAGVGVGVPLALRVDPGATLHQRLASAKTMLGDSPLFDGHNDLPWNIRKFMHNKLHSFNFTAELKKLRPWSRSSWSHTDLPRLREGMVGAQFWVSYVPCEAQLLNAVQLTIEQIDLIKRLIEQYPEDLRLATSADEVEAAFKEGRIASLIGVEGGHAIQNSLGVLRALRDLGVRYLTLTHTCSTPWAECARAQETDEEDPNSPRGLTHFGKDIKMKAFKETFHQLITQSKRQYSGAFTPPPPHLLLFAYTRQEVVIFHQSSHRPHLKTVVREMNRLGLLVDLSHVSQATMREALEVSRAPVIFSHSSVYAICKNPRNVPDDILRRVAVKGGVVMVSFYNFFLTCSNKATISDVIEHINHVRKVAGVDHVGIGADFDGINMLPEGLGDVSGYPQLFAELLGDPTWSMEDLRKLAGQNLLRVMREAEQVRKDLQQQGLRPYEEELPPAPPGDSPSCFYRFNKSPSNSE